MTRFFHALGLVALVGVASLDVAGPLYAQGGARRPATEADGSTPLHRAVREADRAQVQALLRSGANVKAANRYGVTPITLAAINGDAPIIELLLKAGADPNASFGDGQTVLMTAARTGAPDALRVLIRSGANVNAREGWLGETALMWAAAENHADAVRVLIESGADLNAASMVTAFPPQVFDIAGMLTTYLPRGGWTPLMYAARQNSLEAARLIAGAKANLDVADPDGATALVIAIINAHYDLAGALLDFGANPNVSDTSGMQALYAAIDMHTLDGMIGRPMPKPNGDVLALIEKLLAKGADPNARLTAPPIQRYHTAGNPAMGEGTTPLIRAAKNSDIEVMRLLLAHQADITLKQANGTNALMAAITSGTAQFSKTGRIDGKLVETVALCLERGLDPNAVNDRGQSAVHLAAANGSDDVIRLLAAKGAKLDLKDARDLTPLDVAAGKGNARPVPRPTTIALLQELLQPSSAKP